MEKACASVGFSADSNVYYKLLNSLLPCSSIRLAGIIGNPDKTIKGGRKVTVDYYLRPTACFAGDVVGVAAFKGLSVRSEPWD
jgi:hypothetical protein